MIRTARIALLTAFLILSALSVRATSITIQSLAQSNYQGGGSTATLKIFADREFVTSDNVRVFKQAVGGRVWFKSVSCTVSGTTLTIPQFTIDSTTDSSVPSATYTFALYDSSGRLVDTPFIRFQVPYTLGTSITFAQLILWNQTPATYKPGQTYTKEQTDAQIAATAASAATTAATAAVAANTYTRSTIDGFVATLNTTDTSKLDAAKLLRPYLTPTLNITSNAVLADTTLSVNLEAGGIYAFRCEGQVLAGAGGFRVQLGGTHTRTSLWATGRVEDSSGTITATQSNTFGAALTLAGASTSYFRYWGLIEVANAGTLVLQAAQNSSNVANTGISKGAYIILTKLN